MVLVHVQNQAYFRFVTDQSSIALVGFYNKPFALARNSVADLAFLLQVHKARPRHHGRLKARILQDVVNHGGHGGLAAGAAHCNSLRFLRNLCQHLTAVHYGNAQFLGPLQIRVRIFNGSTHHHST